MKKAIAVFDIGMTNKKVAVYDEGLRMLDSVARTFPPLPVGDEALPAHDLPGMEEWFLDTLAAFGRKYAIGAIAVATHGATFVLVGADGKPCAPCLLYTHEPGPEFQERFYAMAGARIGAASDARERLQEVTGTPDLSAMINPAKGLFFMKERFPREFEGAATVLAYPQYWGYRLTGKAAAEGTYMCCHTYLWDWKRERYSAVAEALGVERKMPSPLRSSWEVLGKLKPELAARTGLSPDTIVTMGIHDSNASLLPHIAKRRGRDFILNSTGTWCVLMHPQERFGFEASELGKVVFFNRSALMKPVKTAIFLGGMEYETWSKLIEATSGQKALDPGALAYPGLLESKGAFILPEVVPGSGQFPGSRPRAVEDGREYALDDIKSGKAVPAFMRDGRKAMAVLDASLVIQTTVALERAGRKPGADIFTEGGFRRNADYNALLAAALPGNPAYLTDISEATAFGAAMTAAVALRGGSPAAEFEKVSEAFDVEYKSVAPMAGIDGFDAYRRAWMAALLGGAKR
jgi:sugar (pentulose or hexulose) kinase